MRWALIIGGIIAIALGALWTLQGLNVIGNSPMSGNTLWAVVGPVVFVVGVIGLVMGARRRSGA